MRPCSPQKRSPDSCSAGYVKHVFPAYVLTRKDVAFLVVTEQCLRCLPGNDSLSRKFQVNCLCSNWGNALFHKPVCHLVSRALLYPYTPPLNRLLICFHSSKG